MDELPELPERAEPLIFSLVPWAFLVWGIVWGVSFLVPWLKIPLAVAVTIYWFMGLPAPLVPGHGHVVPPVGNFILTLLVIGAWAFSLWIIFR